MSMNFAQRYLNSESLIDIKIMMMINHLSDASTFTTEMSP